MWPTNSKNNEINRIGWKQSVICGCEYCCAIPISIGCIGTDEIYFLLTIPGFLRKIVESKLLLSPLASVAKFENLSFKKSKTNPLPPYCRTGDIG